MNRIVINILFVLAVAGIIYFGYQHFQNYKELKSQLEQATRTGNATTGVVTDHGAAADVVHRTEVIVRDNRADYQRSYEDAKRDPAIGTWDAVPVPDRLRDLARERRAARERSGGAGDGRRDPAADPGTSR